MKLSKEQKYSLIKTVLFEIALQTKIEMLGDHPHDDPGNTLSHSAHEKAQFIISLFEREQEDQELRKPIVKSEKEMLEDDKLYGRGFRDGLVEGREQAKKDGEIELKLKMNDEVSGIFKDMNTRFDEYGKLFSELEREISTIKLRLGDQSARINKIDDRFQGVVFPRSSDGEKDTCENAFEQGYKAGRSDAKEEIEEIMAPKIQDVTNTILKLSHDFEEHKRFSRPAGPLENRVECIHQDSQRRFHEIDQRFVYLEERIKKLSFNPYLDGAKKFVAKNARNTGDVLHKKVFGPSIQKQLKYGTKKKSKK